MPDADLQPGPEMDRRVAEACGIDLVTTTTNKSHDWQNEGSNYYGTAYTCSRCFQCVLTDDLAGGGDGPCEVSVAFRPSTFLPDAFAAAEKAGLLEWPNVLYHYEVESAFGPVNRRDWKVWNADENFVVGRGSTPTEAISRAILALRPKESA